MSNIKKIVIEVGGVELSLSPEDAKTLKQALDELFPTKSHVQYIPSPYPVYPRPWRWYEYGGGVLSLYSQTTTDGSTSPKINLSASSFKAQ